MNKLSLCFFNIRPLWNIELGIVASFPKWSNKIKNIFLLCGTFAVVSFSHFSIKKILIKTSPLEEEVLEEERFGFAETTVKKKDNVKKMLGRLGCTDEEISKIEPLVKLNLKPGIKVIAEFDEETALQSLVFEIDIKNKVLVSKSSNGEFITSHINIPLEKILAKFNLKVDSISKLPPKFRKEVSLVCKNAGISKGALEIIAEKYYSGDKFSHYGNVVYLSSEKKNFYRFIDSNGKYNFFNSEGKSLLSASMLRMPVNKVKITSQYGMRVHPIFGQRRMHNGVDFSAPAGSPIYAAADGKVTEVGYKAGYGKYVKIDHGNGISTLYAHASRFGKNIVLGTKVKQSNIIAYVGSTGHASGPHLHYEVIKNNKNVNPLTNYTKPLATISKASDFSRFKSQIQKIASLEKKEVEALAYLD